MTDNPDMIKLYKRLNSLLRELEELMRDVDELKQAVGFVYGDVNHIYNRLEAINYKQKHKPEPRPATVESIHGVFKQQRNESREHFMRRIREGDYDEWYL